VSGSQLTRYFRDKQTLIDDVIAWQADATLEREPVLDSIDAWHRWADQVVARQTARKFHGGCEFGSLAGQLAETSPETRAHLADGYDRWLEQFRRDLHTMRDQGAPSGRRTRLPRQLAARRDARRRTRVPDPPPRRSP
jgi:TetR/AcrR family transcriptional repressor of nem operon